MSAWNPIANQAPSILTDKPLLVAPIPRLRQYFTRYFAHKAARDHIGHGHICATQLVVAHLPLQYRQVQLPLWYRPHLHQQGDVKQTAGN